MRSKDLVMKPGRFCMEWLRWRTFGKNRPVCNQSSSSTRYRLEIKVGNHEKPWKLTGRRKTRRSSRYRLEFKAGKHEKSWELTGRRETRRIRREAGILGQGGGCSNLALLSGGGIRDGRNM
jgi:hypothetical protein